MDEETGISRIVTIENERGLHARAAARFVRLAETFNAAVEVEKGGAVVSGLSIMGLMMLAAGKGSQIVLRARGADQAAAIEALVALVAARFDEDE